MIVVNGRINAKREQVYKDPQGVETKSYMLGIIKEGDLEVTQVKVSGDSQVNVGDEVSIPVRLYVGNDKKGKAFCIIMEQKK